MPFKSKAQARYMFAKHPDIAQEFADHTKSIKALPEHVDADGDNDGDMKEKTVPKKVPARVKKEAAKRPTATEPGARKVPMTHFSSHLRGKSMC